MLTMANEVMSIIDPLGRTIHLLEGIRVEEDDPDIYDDVATVIQKPALLIEVDENNEIEFYYFRSVGWYNTLLIMVHFQNNQWEAYSRIKNPLNEVLNNLLKKGKQLI
jgi:hypothetical protein